jgi:hypothetical protein
MDIMKYNQKKKNKVKIDQARSMPNENDCV